MIDWIPAGIAIAVIGKTGRRGTERSIILPERPYQVLAEMAPAGFAAVTKYVVSPAGRVLRY